MKRSEKIVGSSLEGSIDLYLSKKIYSQLKDIDFAEISIISSVNIVETNDIIGEYSNNAGGILGGITNGQDLVLRFALKPTSSILKQQKSINKKGVVKNLRVKGRHDPCLCPRAVPIAEAMVNLVLIDTFLENKISKIENL